MITAKTTIERQATEAAGQGLSLDDACPYPFGSPAADHFRAIYTLALPLASDIRTGYATEGKAQKAAQRQAQSRSYVRVVA